MICEGCGNKEAIQIKRGYTTIHPNPDNPLEKETISYEVCNQCSNLGGVYMHRDALGNRVLFPKDNAPFYSDATGQVHTSQAEFANFLRKEGMVQRDGRHTKKPGN